MSEERISLEAFHAIEESAKCLERAAQGFIEVGNGYPEGSDRDSAYRLADTYGMAANEVRLQIPQYRAMQERNRQLVRAWQRSIGTDKQLSVPNVERWDAVRAAASIAAGSDKHG